MKSLKKLIKWIIGITVIGLICFGVYKFFFDCEKSLADFDRNFILLDTMDYVEINNEVIVKLIKIDDDRCLEEDCEREGQLKVNVLVVNDHRLAYVTLGTVGESAQDLEKLGYGIELIEATTEQATLKLTRLEEK